MIVDEMHSNTPELVKDVYWEKGVPTALPYTEETAHYRKDEPKGSAENDDENDIYDKSRSEVNYPMFKVSVVNGNKVVTLEQEPCSDYEAVDTNLFGWWKNKIRKSQIRRSIRSMSSNVNVQTTR